MEFGIQFFRRSARRKAGRPLLARGAGAYPACRGARLPNVRTVEHGFILRGYSPDPLIFSVRPPR